MSNRIDSIYTSQIVDKQLIVVQFLISEDMWQLAKIIELHSIKCVIIVAVAYIFIK